MSDEKTAGLVVHRVYSYVADDGTVYWSLTKKKQTVSTGQRLVLQSRNGTPVLPFMSYIREQASSLDKDASVEDGPQLEKTEQMKGLEDE